MSARITVLPGDGIGPEITAQAVAVLEVVAERFDFRFQIRYAQLGGCAIDATGAPLPDATVAACTEADAVLLGAVGGPQWDNLPGDKRPEAALLGIRQKLGLFANLRPALIYPALRAASPLRDEVLGDGLDLLVVRELTGGIYFGPRGRREENGIPAAYDTELYTVPEIERIAKVAFELARGRQGRVCSIDKANVLESSRLWRETVTALAAEYPDVALTHMYVDNAAMQLVRHPRQFDTILTSNLFGDILSDEASQITGSIGMLPSASLRGDRFGLYEPIHGSAPDIAGKDIANPIASILSVAMLLRHSLQRETAAAAIEAAVGHVLEQGLRTQDLAGTQDTPVGTRAMGAAVIASIQNA